MWTTIESLQGDPCGRVRSSVPPGKWITRITVDCSGTPHRERTDPSCRSVPMYCRRVNQGIELHDSTIAGIKR